MSSSAITKIAKIGRWILECTAFLLVIFVIGRAVLEQGAIARSVGNGPSALADGGSDHDALVTGLNYYIDGFTRNYGLPDRAAPAGKVYLDPADRPTWSGVYCHYPPGGNWMTGLGFYIFGPRNVPSYRSIPIGLSAVCFLASYFFIRRVFGALLAAASMVALIYVPMTTSMMHALYGHGYATAILVLQTSYVFSCFRLQGFLRPRQLALVFLMGWFQGWLGFDYAFVASLYPLALGALCLSSPISKAGILATIAAGSGFSAAHGAHFMQVALFRQSWASAYSDFFDTAMYRSGALRDPEMVDSTTLHILHTYLIELLPGGQWGGTQAIYIGAVGVAVPLISLVLAWAFQSVRRQVTSGVHLLSGLVISLVVSLMWEMVMQQHSLVAAHKLFLPRHLVFFLFVCILSSSTFVYEIALGLWSRVFEGRASSSSLVHTGSDKEAPCASRGGVTSSFGNRN